MLMMTVTSRTFLKALLLTQVTVGLLSHAYLTIIYPLGDCN